MGGGAFNDTMHVRKNKFVEEWNGRREITEQAFEVNPDTLPAIKGDPRYKNSGLA